MQYINTGLIIMIIVVLLFFTHNTTKRDNQIELNRDDIDVLLNHDIAIIDRMFLHEAMYKRTLIMEELEKCNH